MTESGNENPKASTDSTSESENPTIQPPEPAQHRPRTNQDWWPNQPDLQVLNRPSARSNPLGPDFDYTKEFARLDVEAVKRDLTASDDNGFSVDEAEVTYWGMCPECVAVRATS